MNRSSESPFTPAVLRGLKNVSRSTFARGAVGRREFLRSTAAASAGLVLAFHLPLRGEDTPASGLAPNAWLHIEPNGKISLWVARSEMGQGVRTSMAMILAEELEADWAKIQVQQAHCDTKYGDMVTGGSASVRTGWDPLRKVGAAAREMLISAAAQTWSVKPDECFARAARVVHRPTNRSLSYAELAQKAAAFPVPKEAPLKDPKDFRIVGKSEPRVDGSRIVVGAAKYGIDTKVPGMVYAVIARSPVFGGRVKNFDAARAKAVPGVRNVVEVKPVEMPTLFGFEPGKAGHQHFLWSGVAVVADSTWQAIQGRKALSVEWDEGAGASESAESQRAACVKMAVEPGQEFASVGDAETAFAAAPQKLESVYESPYLAHAPMEPQNCTAWTHDGGCEVWAPTQNAQAVRAAVASALGVEPAAVTVHVTLIGGGFGRRLNVDYSVEAALVSRSVGAPVKVFWTREDDIRHDYYRPASYHRMRAALDAQKQLVAWLHHIVAPTTDGFYEGGEPPDLGGVELGGAGIPAGTLANYRLTCSMLHTAMPRGYWRAVDNLANQFAVQCFTDEVATAIGMDPLLLRRKLIGEPRPLPPPKEGEERADIARLHRVIDVAAEKAGWGKPLSPSQAGARRGRGIAGQYCFGSYVAQVAEVTVERDASFKVDRIVLAIDCGQVVNPDMAAAQLEGGALFGLNAALNSKITLAQGRVQEGNFDNYPMMRIADAPPVEVHIIPSKEAPGGIGELGVPSTAPAVGNALFAATGKRLRRLPFDARELAAS